MFFKCQGCQLAWQINALSLILLSFCAVVPVFAQSETTQTTVLYLFWGDGCPHCANEKVYLAEAQVRYPELEARDFELYYHPENRSLFTAMAEAETLTFENVVQGALKLTPQDCV